MCTALTQIVDLENSNYYDKPFPGTFELRSVIEASSLLINARGFPTEDFGLFQRNCCISTFILRGAVPFGSDMRYAPSLTGWLRVLL